jgi:hypothetical protein
MIKIDFGDIGLKPGDVIQSYFNGETYAVASGAGIPGNGGTLVENPDKKEGGLISLRLLTRRKMGNDFEEDMYIFQLYTFRGKQLRTIYQEKREGNDSK